MPNNTDKTTVNTVKTLVLTCPLFREPNQTMKLDANIDYSATPTDNLDPDKL